MAPVLSLRDAKACKWDLLALGEIMLRFDPGFGRVRNARSFQVWEGGGEYNVARAIRKCFGLRASVVTALPKNDLGWLVEDFVMQGGVDTSHIIWREFDGLGVNTRVGLNFVEKGFGLRAPLGVSDRGHSSTSQIKPGEVDWEKIFGEEGVRWFHTGGIFAALSETTAEVTLEAVKAARRHGTIVSFDLNYRPSLWKARGGQPAARKLNRSLAPFVDIMIGGEEDLARLGFRDEIADELISSPDPTSVTRTLEAAAKEFPNFKVVGTTLRNALSATINDWGAIIYAGGSFYSAQHRPALEIYDRIGGGDGFASGLAYGFLEGKGPQKAVDYGAAHGALAMTTPGDTSMADLSEVEAIMAGATGKVIR